VTAAAARMTPAPIQAAILSAAAVALPMRRAVTGLSPSWPALQESLMQQSQVRTCAVLAWRQHTAHPTWRGGSKPIDCVSCQALIHLVVQAGKTAFKSFNPSSDLFVQTTATPARLMCCCRALVQRHKTAGWARCTRHQRHQRQQQWRGQQLWRYQR
jgi:hypothetical protein